MKKYKIEITRKNGNKKTVAVCLDKTTAELLERTGDKKLLRTYLIEEYKANCRDRREEFWNRSPDEAYEKGIDYEDKRSYSEFIFSDFEDESLQMAIEQLTLQQQEILRLMYIEDMSQSEIAKKYGVSESAISHAVERIYASIRKNYKKK